jgi:glucokinase
MFKRAYANFAKNTALDGLALGGVYIAGGIAPKNKEIFDKEFVKIFEYSHKMGHVLKKIPIYLILNYDIGLLGAGFFGAKQK